jgi:hypothetical protein
MVLASPCCFALDSKTDLFGAFGSDVMNSPRANYTLGIGRSFDWMKHLHIGDEVTLTHTYENNGNHGFLKTVYAAHTTALGVVKYVRVPDSRFTSFVAVHAGETSYSGMNRGAKAFVSGTGGVGYHVRPRWTVSLNETYTKVETSPTYFTSGIGLSHGWWTLSANTNRTSGVYKCRLYVGVSLSALMSGEHVHHPRVIHVTR